MALWKHVLLVIAAVSPAATDAQDFPVMDWGPIIHSEAMGSVMAEAGREGARSSTKRRGPPTPAQPIDRLLSQHLSKLTTGAAPNTTNVSGGYVPNSAVRQRLAQIMGDAAAKNGMAQGEEMRTLVLSGRAVEEYEKIAPGFGLRTNDAVDALAFYLLAQWGVANDHRADVTRAQVAGVRQQAASAYAGVAAQLLTDALRQEFAEMLVIQGAVMSGVHEAAARNGDDAATARYAELARAGGRKLFTIDPTMIALTDAGFRRK
jgi:hypothetical protein